MKKTYIKPNTKSIILGYESMIASSDPSTTTPEVGDTDVEYSRRQGGNSIWDTWSN